MKAYIVTLGCPKNLVDTEATRTILRRSGCDLVSTPDDADVLLVNACSFLESSWNETLEEVERLSSYKDARRGTKLVLMGCLPKHRELDLESALPVVDHFLPSGSHGLLPELVRTWKAGAPAAPGAPPPVLPELEGVRRFDGFEGRDLLTPAHTAYVKVAEGCNRKCSFCAIPKIRGRLITRGIDSIVREVEGHLQRGVREITLLAQDIMSYHHDGKKFLDLVDALDATGVEWIRIFYVHPAGLSMDHIHRLFGHESVCRYLEMPVQHGVDRMLSLMGRSHTRDQLDTLMAGIRGDYPGVAIRSEVMVGFPGETEEDFDQLSDFVDQMEFDSLGIFPYSAEPGTEAAAMEGRVSDGDIRERVERLNAVQEAVAFRVHEARVGQVHRILVDRAVTADESPFEGCTHAGRYYGQAMEVDGEVYLDGEGLTAGRFVTARIDDALLYDLRATSA